MRIAPTEKAQWDKGVVVDFQTNAWVGETVLFEFVETAMEFCISSSKN